MQPEKNATHHFMVQSVVGPNKIVNTNNGPKSKYVIHFENGYKAELLLPRDLGFPHDLYGAGRIMPFRVGYRKDGYLDEISIVEPATNNSGKTSDFSRINLSMQGHPAISALNVAKDLWVAGVLKSDEEAGEIEILQTADLIYKWLLEKKQEGDANQKEQAL